MPAQRTSMEDEQQRIADHLAGVERRLRDDTDQSLVVAERRHARHEDLQARRFATR